MNKSRHLVKKIKSHAFSVFTFLLIGGLFLGGIFFLWVATLKTPDFSSFNERIIASSTKIYDMTGKVLLYDIHEDIKRTVVPFAEISLNVKNATVAIEDSEFYNHKGIRPKSILRALLSNLESGGFSQGGSTITQQIVKNTILTQDKKVSRKFKEWILALKVEQKMSKEQILEIYLNEAPYGGNLYGIQEASQAFFKKDPADLTLGESAYLAAIPNAPTYYSPFGQHKDKLEERKNLVLQRMLDLEFINQDEYAKAKNEQIVFSPQEKTGIKAPHFVMYVRDYLEQKYGKEAVLRGGLKVTTTLDYDLQEKAEEIVKKTALENEKEWNAGNAGLIAIDPKTGQIRSMVGSRDYFDKEIDGNFNITLAKRQPGSSFKPFVYTTAWMKGYTPETVLFDVFTEFNTGCTVDGNKTSRTTQDCYHPQDYDNVYKGPMTLRSALAQSRNIPSVQLLYLAGVKDSIKTAESMGITTLGSPDRYGLTLVLGGGEVTLLDMVSSYSVFATEGIKRPPTAILSVEDSTGKILESYQQKEFRVLDKNITAITNDILSDNTARTPLFGTANNFMNFGATYDVAGKTGTTNNNRDAWMVGYSPDIVIGVWSGNNDNTPMKKGSAISGHLWREVMNVALPTTDKTRFSPPQTTNTEGLKPILRGLWLGGKSVFIDKITNKLATEFTPEETKESLVVTNVHSILYWINKSDPRDTSPVIPEKDSQYEHWEYGVQRWWNQNKNKYPNITESMIPTEYDSIHTEENKPTVVIGSPSGAVLSTSEPVFVQFTYTSKIQSPLLKTSYFLNGKYVGESGAGDTNFNFTIDNSNIQTTNTLLLIAYDSYYNKTEVSKELNFAN